MKLLIADDQQSTHQFLMKMIDWPSLGVSEVHHAFHGKEAVHKVEEISPELLILDLKMPMLDGIGVLRETGHLLRKPKTMILSAYDEFEYARNAMRFGVRHYLLKPIDTAAVAQTVEELRKQAERETEEHLLVLLSRVCRLRTADPETAQAIDQGFRTLGLGGYYCVFVSATGDLTGKLPAAEEVSSEVRRYAIQLDTTAAFIVYAVAEEPADMKSGIGDFCRGELPEGWNVGVSRYYEQAGQMTEALRQCQAASGMGFYEGNEVHIFSGRAFPQEVFTQPETDELVRSMQDKLEQGYSAQAIRKAVVTMFAAIRRKKPEPAKVYPFCYHVLLMTLKKQKQLQSGDMPPLSMDRLECCKTLAHLEDVFTAYLAGAALRNEGEAAFSTDQSIRLIKQYADANYGDDLSLDTVSAKFIINKYQLCRLFKREFDVSYWSYVTRVRMEKAAELLLNTALKSAHIAQKVGYPDESHFSNVFKKYYGIRPTEYKHNHTQESSTTHQ